MIRSTSFFPPYIGIDLNDRIVSLPFVTCRAHMRRSTALTVAVSCVCQTYQLRRYRKHPRRHSMLLRPHARQHWLANCRSRAGSSLGAGSVGGREKRNRACAWLGLIPNSFPATTRQVPTQCSLLPRRPKDSCVWTEFLTTEQWRSRESRSLMHGRSSSWLKSILARLFPLLYSLTIFHVSSTVTAPFALLNHTYPLSNNPKSYPNH